MPLLSSTRGVSAVLSEGSVYPIRKGFQSSGHRSTFGESGHLEFGSKHAALNTEYNTKVQADCSV
eukprot:584676-Prorocentrum_minimum.AAC.1